MKKILLCAVLFAVIGASGQQPTTYNTGIGHGIPLIPTEQSKLPNALVPVVITSDYYAGPKVLVVHILNNSGKDITGYTIIIRHKNADGTVDKGGFTENTSDMLNTLLISEMAKDPAASEHFRGQSAAYNSFPASAGTGIFVAGENRDTTLTGINSGSELDIVAGAVFYTDGTFDKQDEDSFKRMLAMRQSGLQQMKEANNLIRKALADTTNEHPVATVLTELHELRVEEMSKPNHTFFPMDDGGLEYLQRPGYGEQRKTERERLMQYVEEQEKKVELMTPHCHLEISVQEKQK